MYSPAWIATEPSARSIAPSSWRTLLVCAVLFLGTWLIFGRALGNEFLNYDDPDYVTQNAHVQAGLTFATIRWAFTTTTAGNWHPLTWLSHALDWQVFGGNPRTHHAINITWHACNAVLAFLVLRQLTGAFRTAALCATLFAWHPLRVESVAWVAERKDVLCAFFFLLSLLAYARQHCRAGSPDPAVADSICSDPEISNSGLSGITAGSGDPALHQSQSRFFNPLFWSFVFFALALLAKPMAVTLPFVLLLLDYWPLQRLSARTIVEKAPFVALSIAVCVVTYLAQKHAGSVVETLPLADRLANATIAIADYLRAVFWPFDLAVGYPRPSHWPATRVAAAALVVALISATVIWQRRQRPYLFVGWCWFLGMLVPVIGLVQAGLQARADRYTYLPSLGLLIALLWLAREIVGRPALRRLALPAAALVLAGCAARTWDQLAAWKSSRSLFEHALAANHSNYLAQCYLGTLFFNEDRFADARACFAAAVALKPDYATARERLALADEMLARAAAAHGAIDAATIEAWGCNLAREQGIAGIELDAAELGIFMQGFARNLEGQPPPTEFGSLLPAIDRLAKERRKKIVRAVEQHNEAAAAAFFGELKKRPNLIELPGHVFAETTKPGEGAAPKLEQTVNIHYVARLIDGREFMQFGPIDLVLVPNRSVCRGWTDTLQRLRKGGAMRLYVPPPLSEVEAADFGIEPGSAMIFDVELLDIKDTPSDVLASSLAPPPGDDDPPPEYPPMKVIAAWGWSVGHRTGIADLGLNEMERTGLIRAVRDGIVNARAPTNLAALQPLVEKFVATRKSQVREAARQKRRAEMEALFAALKQNPNVVEQPDGLRYEIVKQGEGPLPKPGQIVLVDYTGRLIDGSVFDRTDNEPLNVEVGSVIRGWNEGIQRIAQGGKIKLYIPPELGYGETSMSGHLGPIPPGATLIYEIELLDIKDTLPGP